VLDRTGIEEIWTLWLQHTFADKCINGQVLNGQNGTRRPIVMALKCLIGGIDFWDGMTRRVAFVETFVPNALGNGIYAGSVCQWASEKKVEVVSLSRLPNE